MKSDTIQTQLDRMRFTNDTLSANLILGAIVLDCLYFVSIYQSDVGNYYYSWVIGASVIYNLLFLLGAFLCSEGVKGRKTGYTGLLLFLGVMQFARVFYLPMNAWKATVAISGQQVAVMSGGQFAWVAGCLAASGVCILAGAVISFINNKKLADYMRTLQ